MNKIYRVAAIAVIVMALIGIAFAFFPKVTQFRSYQEVKEDLDRDISAKEEAIKELRHDQERFSTDKYFVQQIAHEIGFAHEGETIYQFNESDSSNLTEETRPRKK